MPKKPDFEIEFDPGTIKHLGIQMYSTLPPVIGELVSNSWDADAPKVEIQIPETVMTATSEILIQDAGLGMTDKEIRQAYLIIGRDRREADGTDKTPLGRPVMGRKGIGKFSAFGIAGEIEVESVKAGETSRFVMRYDDFVAAKRKLLMPSLPATGKVKKGTRITLRNMKKFRDRAVSIAHLRRALARRFSIIGAAHGFEVVINGKPITPTQRDLKKMLAVDDKGQKYLWEFKNVEIKPGTGWKVSGWIGALDRTTDGDDPTDRGVAIFARGKLVQEPFVFGAVVGQQYALSYLVGELHAEFVDAKEDTIATSRNQLVWDMPANEALKEWGVKEMNRIAREWADRRRQENERTLEVNPVYQQFVKKTEEFEERSAKKVVDRLIRDTIKSNPDASIKDAEPVIQLCIDFLEFDAFQDLASDLSEAKLDDVPRIVELFREWELVEAKEMLRVTKGRIQTIEKLQGLIKKNALEVPTLHKFLKEFPWVLDPRWNLIDDEVHYSRLLREHFPESKDVPERDRRIDFLCVRESSVLVVVEIKRPKSVAKRKALDQIGDYVKFIRAQTETTTDPAALIRDVVGYLLVGDVSDLPVERQSVLSLERDHIYVRKYSDLLGMVEKSHKEFLDRYKKLRDAKKKSSR